MFPYVRALHVGGTVGRRGGYQQGPDVRRVQHLLDMPKRQVDAAYGPQTAQAVREFQRGRGLTVDGVVGPNTWAHLPEPGAGDADRPDPDEDDSPAYPGHYLQRGDDGHRVGLVQHKVGATVDGEFGPKTEKAVRKWQKRHGLEADGIVGPKTYEAMF